jgi:hypothetical protein
MVPVTSSDRRATAPPVVYMARASVGDTAWAGATPSRSVAARMAASTLVDSMGASDDPATVTPASSSARYG